MKLFYEDDLVQLYQGSCITGPEADFYPWLKADVLVTDPPYGTANMTGKGRGGYGRKGFQIMGDETTEVRDKALAVWWCSNMPEKDFDIFDMANFEAEWLDTPIKPALVFGSPRMPDPPIPIRDRLVWDKKRPGMNGGPWRYTHESIYVTDGWVRIDNAHTSIITSYPAPSEHLHRKPIGLMEALIACAPPGVIADPFAGSGSTVVAARNLGRKVIAVELEEKFCQMIVDRLVQPALAFDGEPW